MKEDKTQKRIPRGKAERTGVVGAATARIGLKTLEHATRKPFMSPEKAALHREETDTEIARTIFSTLAKLKGAPLKLAQMISMELDLLPEVYQKELARSASQVPPMNRALIRTVLTRELGAPPEEVFRSFESQPFAAASLGQVHRAVSRDGHSLAVKVQYPGVAEAVRSDMGLIDTLLRITPLSGVLGGAMEELRERIVEELDYRREAASTRQFRERCSSPGILVPEVFDDYSTGVILTTSLVEGRHLEEWLAGDPSAEMRNHYGQILCDLFAEWVHEHRVIHADPNVGNFLFRDDGLLGVIDFGCVRELDEGFVRSLVDLVRAIDRKDMKTIKELYQGIGFSIRGGAADSIPREDIFSLLEWITRPVRCETFDFGEHRDYFAEGRQHISLLRSLVEGYRGPLLYYARFEYGLYRILHRLGARVSIRLYD